METLTWAGRPATKKTTAKKKRSPLARLKRLQPKQVKARLRRKAAAARLRAKKRVVAQWRARTGTGPIATAHRTSSGARVSSYTRNGTRVSGYRRR